MLISVSDQLFSVAFGVVTLLIGLRVIGPRVGTNARYDTYYVKWLKHFKWVGPLIILLAATQMVIKIGRGLPDREPRQTADQLLGLAVEHIESKRFGEAAAILERLSAQGNPVAEFMLAEELYKGTIKGSSADRYLLLLISSAKRKYVPAQFALCLHHNDPIQAYAWCQVVANANHRFSDEARGQGVLTLNERIAPSGPPSVDAAKAVAASYVKDFHAEGVR